LRPCVPIHIWSILAVNRFHSTVPLLGTAIRSPVTQSTAKKARPETAVQLFTFVTLRYVSWLEPSSNRRVTVMSESDSLAALL
jgi:hypothetical protein